MNEYQKYLLIEKCALDEMFASKVYIGIVNEGFQIEYDDFMNFIDEQYDFYNEGIFSSISDKIKSHKINKYKKEVKELNGLKKEQQKYGIDNSKKISELEAKHTKQKKDNKRRIDKKENSFPGKINRTVTNVRDASSTLPNTARNVEKATDDVQHMTGRLRKTTDKINKKNATIAAGVGAAAIAGKAIYDKSLKKKYAAWKAKNPKKREYIGFKQWVDMGKPLNEDYLAGYYDAIDYVQDL